MNIFGIGGAELILIILIMLVVAGPQRMLRWAFLAGKYAAKLRDMWSEFADVLQKEMDDAGIDVQVPRTVPTRQSLRESVNRFAEEAAKPVREPMQKLREDFDFEMDNVRKQTNLSISAEAQRQKQSRNGDMTRPAPDDTPDHPPEDNSDAESGFGAWSQPGS